MSDEYHKLKIVDFEPFKWYNIKWSDPGRYVSTIGLKWRNRPILLVVNQYVSETSEGKYTMKVDILHGPSYWFNARDMLSNEKKYIEKALKNSKREVSSDILHYIFSE